MKFTSTLFAALILSTQSSAEVLVVGTGAGDYPNIPEAHTAASPGDTIYFRPGTYAVQGNSFRLEKPVHLVGSGANVCHLSFQLEIAGSYIGQGDVSVSAFTIRGMPHEQSALVVRDCEGRVHLQDLHVDPIGVNQVGTPLSFGTQIFSNNEVVSTNCVFEGRPGESTVDGGSSGDHALRISLGDVALYGVRVLEGEGGEQNQSHWWAGGAADGGTAIWVTGTVLNHAGCAFVGGAPGDAGGFGVGSPGQEVVLTGGASLAEMTHDRFFFDLPCLASAGTSQALRVFGPAGTNVFALTSSLGNFRPLGLSFGILHLGGSLSVVSLGSIPPGGQLDISFDTPLLGGLPAAVQRIQLFASGAGHRMISDPRIRVIVPPGL